MSDTHKHNHSNECCNEHHSHDEGCGCGHNHDEHTMKLQLEDGSMLECSVIDVFDLDEDRAYIALLPLGEDEVLLYRYVEKEDGSFELLNIETDEEFSEVEDAFFELFEEGTFDEEYEYADDEDFDEDGEFDDDEEYEYEDEDDEEEDE